MKKYAVIDSSGEIMDTFMGVPMISDDPNDLSITPEKGEKIIEIEWNPKNYFEKKKPPSPRVD